jgi:hypothetical protein
VRQTFEIPLDIPDVTIENVTTNRIGDIEITVKSLLEGTPCHSELTSCSRNTNHQAALQAFAIFTFTLCSTWFVMTRNRSACCS